MAEGIRIQLREDLFFPDDGMIVVRDHARPFPPPRDGQRLEDVQPVCGICHTEQHFVKTYHIQLRAGAAIVSTEVWANLQALADNPFVYANPVPEPPGQIIRPGQEVQLVEKVPQPIWTPSFTKQGA